MIVFGVTERDERLELLLKISFFKTSFFFLLSGYFFFVRTYFCDIINQQKLQLCKLTFICCYVHLHGTKTVFFTFILFIEALDYF